MIIDIHTHPVFPEGQMQKKPPMNKSGMNEKLDVVNNPHQAQRAMAMTSQQYNGRPPCALPLNEFKNEMEEAGIDMVAFQVGIAKGASAREHNERVAKIMKQFDGRAIGFAGFDPSVGEQAVAEIEYAVNELGFKGIKMVPSILGLDINDKAFYPCYAKAEELGIPVMIHTGTGLILGCRAKHVHPLMVDDVAFDFPNLKIICAHLGGWNYMDVHGLLVRHKNVYADLSAWPLSPQYMKLVPWDLFEETVPDKLFLGSDYPAAQTPKEALASARTLPVSDEFKKKILGENAAKLFGL